MGELKGKGKGGERDFKTSFRVLVCVASGAGGRR